jgi:hypothetical protein
LSRLCKGQPSESIVVTGQAHFQVPERSPSSTLLHLLAHSPVLTAEWFVGSSSGTRYVPRDEPAIGHDTKPEDASERPTSGVRTVCEAENYPSIDGEPSHGHDQDIKTGSIKSNHIEEITILGRSSGLTGLNNRRSRETCAYICYEESQVYENVDSLEPPHPRGSSPIG